MVGVFPHLPGSRSGHDALEDMAPRPPGDGGALSLHEWSPTGLTGQPESQKSARAVGVASLNYLARLEKPMRGQGRAGYLRASVLERLTEERRKETEKEKETETEGEQVGARY